MRPGRETINKFIRLHSTIKIKEKGEFGEVFTPVSVIDDMLAALPASVWRSPKLRWLDPACGVGQFPLKIISGGNGYIGLFEGLAKAIPNKLERMRHILGQLYCYDINPKNTAVLRSEFSKLSPGAPNNVTTGDFLTSGDIGKFDIIVGNPPYNSNGTKRIGEKRLHVRFVSRALEILSPNGYLLFVCPPNYRQAGSTMNKLFLDRDGSFKYIHIYGADETHKLFKIQARVDSFLWANGPDDGKTHIVDEYGNESNVLLDLNQHIPNFGHTIFEKLRKGARANIKAFRTAEATTITCTGFSSGGKYPILHLIVKDGLKILQRKKPHSLQSVPKAILNGLGVPYIYDDRKGEFGVSQTPVVIIEPSQQLINFLKSKLFVFIAWGLRLTGNNNLPYLFDCVPQDYGASIQWTNKELELIESFEVPTFDKRPIKITCNKTRRVKK